MLPLHTIFRNLPSAFSFLIILTSCSNRSKTDLAVIEALNESIENSNTRITASTYDVLESFQGKLADYGSRERASVWYPKAQMIQIISKRAIDYIERIKLNLNKSSTNDLKKIDAKEIFENDSSGLYEMMINYKNDLLQIDSTLKKEFGNTLKVFTNLIDTSRNNRKDLLKNYFDGVSIVEANAILNKLKNNIRINEERTITFCYDHCGSTDEHGLFSVTNAIISQNSTIVQPGEEVEIIAGIGEFTRINSPKIYVYKEIIPMNENAISIYKLKAPSQPGKYYVPVKINYTDQNGMQQSVAREVEYTVANIQKQ